MAPIKDKSFKLAATVMTVLYSVLMFVLFFRQCIEYKGLYVSDMEAYILEASGLESGYEFPYPIMFWVARFFMLFAGPEVAMAISVTLLNALSMYLLTLYLGEFIKEKAFENGMKWSAKWYLPVILASLSVFFVSMVYAPRNHAFFGFNYIYRCSGVYTPNPFWNATYMATRPFSIVCFFAGVRLLDNYESRLNKRDFVVFALSLLLTTMTKPSYSLVAMAVFAIILVYRVLVKKLKNFKNSFIFGCSFLPAGIALIFQYLSVFLGTNSHGEQTGIGFEIGKAWSLYSINIPLSIVMALAFPIGVLIINIPKIKNTTYFRHGWQILIAGLIMFLCLYEKGFRMEHVNFSWGYMHGLFFAFVVSLMMLISNTLEKKGKIRTLLVAAGWIGYAWHLVCGIIYFVYIFRGNNSGLF